MSLLHEFVTEQEEQVGTLAFCCSNIMDSDKVACLPPSIICLQDLLAAADGGTWETLAKRRVQHFGYKFEYWVSVYPDLAGMECACAATLRLSPAALMLRCLCCCAVAKRQCGQPCHALSGERSAHSRAPQPAAESGGHGPAHCQRVQPWRGPLLACGHPLSLHR